ncbi:large conductance mechanosensitive channel protein MscL [Nocardioides sp. LML1-1-1.1]|uniref:large conductance mechanosensitive channel protein MscL n=1 Tax=Nocardioides sp. LML1-1-1.1 TaxID=3135248 RepID=UPI00342CF138
MSGFKKFLLQGNLVDLAVAFIIGTAFAAVVTTFTATLLGFIGKVFDQPDFSSATIADVNVGLFINAVIAFVIMAAVVYFLVVTPYTKAKEKFFPDQPEAEAPDIVLLTQIRDALTTR